MEFKGTQGNWKIDYDDAGIYSEHDEKVIEGNIICIAPVDWKESMKTWEANAKLIACAPEILEMLKECAEWLKPETAGIIDLQKDYLIRVEKIIKKATE